MARPNKQSSPRRCLAGEIISSELGKWVKSEKRKKREDTGQKRDEDAGDSGGGGIGGYDGVCRSG